MTSSGDPSPAGLPPSVTTIVQHHHPRACLPAPPVRFTPLLLPPPPPSPSCGNLPRNSALQTAGSDPSCVCSNNRRGRKSGRRFFSPSTRYGFHGSSLQPFRERGMRGGGERKKKDFFFFLSRLEEKTFRSSLPTKPVHRSIIQSFYYSFLAVLVV